MKTLLEENATLSLQEEICYEEVCFCKVIWLNVG